MHVIDLNEEHYPAQLTTTWEGDLNGNQSLSAVIKPSKVNLQFIHDITEMWRIVDDDDTEYKIMYCKRQGSGKLLNVEVKALPKFLDDLNMQRVYERYDQHMTANAYFHLVFDDSGYNFILNGTFEAQEWEGLGEGSTRLEMFKNGLNRYKAEFRIVGNTFYIENLIGNDTSHRYEHRLNASNIVQEIDANEFYTYAKGYGDYGDGEGGEDWQNAKLIREYTSPLAKIPAIGMREAPPIKNGNITIRATMDSQLKILVDESLKISVTADIHDLTKQGYPIAQSNLGDRVFLIDRRIGFDEEIRVAHKSVTKNWKGEVIALNLTFGVPGIVKRHQSNLAAAMKNITSLLEGKIKLPFSVYDARMQEAIKAMNSALTQLTVLDDGSLAAIDPNNPNFMVMLKSTGLFLSEDGGATPKQAIWGGGINASVISTGTMLADRIAGGVLMSLNGRTEYNLNTGQLKTSDTTFELGGSADIEFLDSRNKLVYQRFDSQSGFNRTAGIGIGTSISNRFPVIYMGATGTGKGQFGALDDNWFSGFISNTTQREATDGIGNSVVGYRFHVRNKAVSYNKGWEFNLNGSNPALRPINSGIYDYLLGVDGNRWREIWAWDINGTIVGTSTINAKTGIENVNGKQAFDYFDMMDIKSFFYKEDDLTNPYNRKVSPIIEQLDPVLEKLYKANVDGLDINSNLFLLASAFKYYARQTDERLEVLENGA